MTWISVVQRDHLVVEEPDLDLEATTGAFSVQRIDAGLRIYFRDDQELARLMSQLRDMGVGFGGAPHGWPPAEVFVVLRDRGLVAGTFEEVTFAGPGVVRRRTR
jgi:hypothetical protein